MDDQEIKTNEENNELEEEQLKLQKLKEAFVKIIDKYNLKEEKKAKEIADYLTKDRHNKISSQGFAKKFKMSETESKIVLSFILKGIEFKENHIDNHEKNS